MSKVYSVKSNARRDAKKRGLDVGVVIACKGGWTIAMPAKAAKKPRAAGQKVKLVSAIKNGWAPLPALMSELGWQAHTVRGAISTIAKAEGFKIERRREDGVTSYRVA